MNAALPIVVLGGGGHGRVVIDALLAAGETVQGVIDPDPAVADHLPAGVPWLGGDAVLASLPPGQVRLANGIGSVGRPDRRRRIFHALKDAGYAFAIVRHPSVVLANTAVELGEGSQIMAGAVMQTGARIGMNVILNTRSSLDHDCVIGDHCHIAPGAILCGGVTVGAGTHIGTGAVLVQNVRIGADCVVGANATILRDVADGMTVISNSELRYLP